MLNSKFPFLCVCVLESRERRFDKYFCSSLVSNSNVMLDGQEFPVWDLRIRDAIEHFGGKKEKEGVLGKRK